MTYPILPPTSSTNLEGKLITGTLLLVILESGLKKKEKTKKKQTKPNLLGF